jgi:hypothetical protein
MFLPDTISAIGRGNLRPPRHDGSMSDDFPESPANAPVSVLDTSTATSNGRSFRSSLPPWHHPRKKLPDDVGFMLAGGCLQAYKTVRTHSVP